jgi:hypothetical protein
MAEKILFLTVWFFYSSSIVSTEQGILFYIKVPNGHFLHSSIACTILNSAVQWKPLKLVVFALHGDYCKTTYIFFNLSF